MKTRILFLIATTVFSFGLLKSQNLMINGDVESWTGGVPDGWALTDNITQESTTVHSGNFSARQTSAATSQKFQQVVSVEAGQEYTISYWYYDNDPDAKTRIWSYWLTGSSTLPDNADVLRPGAYSTDDPSWVQFSVTLTAPATADGFRFEVRGYQEASTGGSVFYDDFSVSGDVTIDPEPSNYPTAFAANTTGLTVDLSWTDATGTQLPSAYIIMAGTSPGLPVPVDGTPVADDLDLSDGSGSFNVNYGEQTASFSGLQGNTPYYFTIYPYTNSGPNIDFKTDGTAPSASATTSDITVIESENFDDSWGNWTPVSVIGDEVWDRDNTYGINSTPCARMNGYNGGPVDNEDWLISPALNLDDYDNEILTFFTAYNYTGPALEALISEDYSGSGDPNAATWTSLTYTPSPGSWTWTASGDVDISSFIGTSVYIAFKYTSNTSQAATWELDDISIVGQGDITIYPEPTNYPTAFTATPASTSIALTWTDATGTQLPDGYIVYASTTSSLPVPVDGTPIPNDPDLSDGSGAMNVNFGLETVTFSSLDAGQTYYFSIYPYTNSGANIDYKNDGTAPSTQATTTVDPEPTNYPADFTASANTSSIDLTWTDASGAQLPVAYIIFAGTDASLPVPVDGTPVADDLDLSDGSGAMNVAYGTETATFSGLTATTDYYFSIYPYTNSGASIDFKTDGTAPTATATTSASSYIVYQPFDNGFGDWDTISVVGDQTWVISSGYGFPDPPCAYMNGYSGGNVDNEDWLISPAMNLSSYESVIMNFNNARSYDGAPLELKISTDYTGSGDPNNATWDNLSYTLAPAGNTYVWTPSGDVDLSGYLTNSVYVAFKYTSSTTDGSGWEVDEITISGLTSIGVSANKPGNRVRIFPNPATQFIDVEQNGNAFTGYRILSITGNVVLENTLDRETTKINISGLAPGVYFISLTGKLSGQTEARKLIIR